MVPDALNKAINEQIQAELESAYLYLSMSAYFEQENLPGMAAWMMAQAKEEQEHAMKFYHHLVERGGTVEFLALSKPKSEFESPLEVFTASWKHEQYITKRIHDLYSLATKENDYASFTMLHWFIDEQVEEESTVEEIVHKLEMIENHAPGLLMLDRELGSRGSH